MHTCVGCPGICLSNPSLVLLPLFFSPLAHSVNVLFTVAPPPQSYLSFGHDLGSLLGVSLAVSLRLDPPYIVCYMQASFSTTPPLLHQPYARSVSTRLDILGGRCGPLPEPLISAALAFAWTAL